MDRHCPLTIKNWQGSGWSINFAVDSSKFRSSTGYLYKMYFSKSHLVQYKKIKLSPVC